MSAQVRSYRDLEVWRKALVMATECYELARSFPMEERYGLASQLRRAAVSVAANIAEGRGREHSGDLLRHLSIAHGSLAEVETLLEVADRVDYLDPNRKTQLIDRTAEVGRMLNGLRRSVRSQFRRP